MYLSKSGDSNWVFFFLDSYTFHKEYTTSSSGWKGTKIEEEVGPKIEFQSFEFHRHDSTNAMFLSVNGMLGKVSFISKTCYELAIQLDHENFAALMPSGSRTTFF